MASTESSLTPHASVKVGSSTQSRVRIFSPQTPLVKNKLLRFNSVSPKVEIWVFPKNNGTLKSSILIGFSILNHPFFGTPIFGNSHLLLGHSTIFQKKILPANGTCTTCLFWFTPTRSPQRLGSLRETLGSHPFFC